MKKEDDSSKEEKNKEGGSDKCVYDTTTTCLFNGGIYCGKLEKSETLIFNLFIKDSHKTVITVENTTVENKKCNVLLNINKAKISSKVITEKVLPIFEVKMDIVFKIDDINIALDKESLLPIQKIPQNILNDAETKIKTSIENIFEKTKEYDCDIFKLKERLYKYNYDDYEKLKDDILQNVILDLKVNCYSFKK